MSKVVKIGDIASLKTGPFGTQFSAKEYTSEGIPVINVKNIGYGQILENEPDYIHESTRDRLSEHILKTGDIVFGRKGSVDRHAYISENYNGWLQGSDCIRLRFQEDVNTRYISHYLKLDHVKKQINHASIGSTMASLNTDILKNIKIILPELSVQNSIESVLSSLESKVDVNSKICCELEAMAKILYDYWFVQFDFPDENGKPYRTSGGEMVWNEQLKREIPKGWEVTNIGKITANFDSKRIPLSQNERNSMKGDIPYYGATGVMDYIHQFIFDGQYVLIAEDGSVMDSDGHPIVQMIWGKTWVNNHAHVLEGCNGYSNELLYFVLKDIPVIKIMTGSIQKKINQDNLNNYKIPQIPHEIANQFTSMLKIIFSKLRAMQMENSELSTLRDWLLPMLMNGQARVE